MAKNLLDQATLDYIKLRVTAMLRKVEQDALAQADMRAALGDEDAAKDALAIRMQIDMRERIEAKKARESRAAEARKIIPFPRPDHLLAAEAMAGAAAVRACRSHRGVRREGALKEPCGGNDVP